VSPARSGGTVTAVSWNMEKGAHWEEGTAWLKAQNPDIVFQQEAQPEQARLQADRLGMDVYVADHRDDPRPFTPHRTAIFLKRGGRLAFDAEHPQTWAPWIPPANITVRFRDPDGALSPRRLSCVSGHGCYWNPDYRLTEAQWHSTLAKPGWLALCFADWNSPRLGELPDGWWEEFEDVAYVANRTYIDADGRRSTDDRADRAMLGGGYIELARYAAKHLDQPEAMRPTTGYRRRPGRPSLPPYTIDRGYCVPEVAPALLRFTVCADPDLRRISDHCPQKAEFDADTLRAIMHCPTALYRPDGGDRVAECLEGPEVSP